MDVYPIIKVQLEAKKITEKQQNQAVDYIDLRYDTGLAVGWKTVEKITEQKLQINNKNNRLKSAYSAKSLS
jgi:cell division protein FtsQ